MSRLLAHWRNVFLAGLLVTIPVVVTAAIAMWLFVLLTNYILRLLEMMPSAVAQTLSESWLAQLPLRLFSLALLVLGITIVGVIARNVVGKRVLDSIEAFIFLRLPMLATVYSTIKEIGNAIFSSQSDAMFRQVVMIEYPRYGLYCIGFITAEACDECRQLTGKNLVSVFIPTSPNPTSGFMLMIPRDQMIMLKISVTEAMRMVISGGAVRPGSGGQVSVSPPVNPPPPDNRD